MDLLSNWLAPTIRQELSRALQWKKRGFVEEKLPGTNGQYSDDGSNLRIQSSTNGVVQISKFLEFEEPVVATVTDRCTRVNARISIAATRKYEGKERKPFTKDKIGGLIQILGFEIVATHIGPKANRMMLFVNHFKSLGSDGSTISHAPRPIESPDKGCFDLLQELKAMREQEKADGNGAYSTRDSSTAPSIKSQSMLATSNEESPDSQSFLITQVPVARKICLKPKQNAAAYETEQYKKSGATNAVVARVEIKVPRNSTGALRRGLAEQAKVEVNHPNSSAGPLPISNRNGLVTIGKETTVLNNGATKAASDEHALTNAHGKTNTKIPNESHSATETNNLERSIDTPGPITALSEASQRPFKKRRLNNRISRCEVRIPKDQEALLNRKDSWLPPEPGQKEPRANVPIDLLQAFNEEADSREKSAPAHEIPPDRAASVQDDDSPDSQSSDSDSDIASAQWPPSPDRNQLPPDSSPDQDRHVKDMETTKSAARTLAPGNAPSTVITVSSTEETGNEPAKKNDASNAENGPNNPISLLSSSLNGSAQPASKEPSQYQTEEVIDNSQEIHPPTQMENHLDNISKGENQFENGIPSPELIPSSHSLPDSDIEMTVPIPLYESTQPPVNHSPGEIYPSTALVSKQPFTQVKRTPYADGYSHGESARRFVNGGWTKRAEKKDPIHGISQEGNTQIPCTTSTFKSNSEDSGTSSHVAIKNQADPGQVSSREKSTIEEHVFKDPSSTASIKLAEVYDGMPLQESLSGKRPLLSNDLLDKDVSSKRLKMDSRVSHAESTRMGEISAGSPMLKPSNDDKNSMNPVISASQSNLEMAFPTNDKDKEAAGGREALINRNRAIELEFDDFTIPSKPNSQYLPPTEDASTFKKVSATVTTKPNEPNTDDSHGSYANHILSEPAFKNSSIGLHQNERHITMSRIIESTRGSSPHRSLPLKKGVPENKETETLATISFNKLNPLASTSKAHERDTNLAHTKSCNTTDNRPKDLVPGIEKSRMASPQAVYDYFRSIYPEYAGNFKHFMSLCTNIERLWKQDRLHKSMWDDFLIRSKIEYAHHVQEYMENGEDPLPYEKFYNEEIDEPRFRKKILTPLNLEMIVQDHISRNILSRTSSIAATPVKRKLEATFPDAAVQVANGLPTGAKSAIKIDLTQDDMASGKTEREEWSKSPVLQPSSRRRLPWLSGGNGAGTSNYEPRQSKPDKQSNRTPPEPAKHRSKKIISPDKQPRLGATFSEQENPKSRSSNVDARGKDAREISPGPWWQDDNTPFKDFVRSYLAIRPGKGNAFANPEDIARGKREHERNKIRGLEDLDVLNWKV